VIAVFDTNIVIDALNGISEADTEFGLYERVIISRVTWMEILVGVLGKVVSGSARVSLDVRQEALRP
jgi:hypothetical protein